MNGNESDSEGKEWVLENGLVEVEERTQFKAKTTKKTSSADGLWCAEDWKRRMALTERFGSASWSLPSSLCLPAFMSSTSVGMVGDGGCTVHRVTESRL